MVEEEIPGMYFCLFVCLFACLLVCLFACLLLFVCLSKKPNIMCLCRDR